MARDFGSSSASGLDLCRYGRDSVAMGVKSLLSSTRRVKRNDLVHSFEVTPFSRGCRLRVRVFVYPNKKRMVEAGAKSAKRDGYSFPHKRTLCAYVKGYDSTDYSRSPRARKSLVCAEMFLCLGWLEINTIAHECYHAAMRLTERKYPRWIGDPAMDFEETIAYSVGNLTALVISGLHLHGLLDSEAIYRGRRSQGHAEARVSDGVTYSGSRSFTPSAVRRLSAS